MTAGMFRVTNLTPPGSWQPCSQNTELMTAGTFRVTNLTPPREWQPYLRVLLVPRELHLLRGHRAHRADVPQRLVRHVGRQAEHGGDLAVQRLAPARVPLDEKGYGHHQRVGLRSLPGVRLVTWTYWLS